MARRALAAIAVALFLTTVPIPSAPAETPQPRRLFELEFPAGIAFGFDKMFITERPGRIRVVEEGRLLSEPLAAIPTNTGGENGLLGIAASPDPSDRAVYVFATDPAGDSNDVWRVPIDGGEPRIVVEGLSGGGYHNGGGVVFDRDGMLLVSNGESHQISRSQDPNVVGGKVYRYMPSGEIPDDNPFPGSPALSIGHRNPFGLALDPFTGLAWTTENGPSSFDEINRITPGSNHAWPVLVGPGCEKRDLDDCSDPVLAYEDVIVPTGIAFAGRDAPERYVGDLFFGTYGEASLHHVELNEARDEAVSDERWPGIDEPVVAVAWGPEGLYFSTPTTVNLLPLARDGAEPSPEAPAAPSPSPSAGEDDPALTGPGFGLVVVILVGLFVASRRSLSR